MLNPCSILRILHLTENKGDSDLVHQALAAGGFTCDVRVVGSRPEFISCLELGRLDIILSDYRSPGFGGLPALELAHELCPEVPLLFFSDLIGDERSVEALKHGAVDFVLKNNPTRLVLAVQRALQVAASQTPQKRMKQTEEDLRHSESRIELVAHAMHAMVWDWDIMSNRLRFSNGLKGLCHSPEGVDSRFEFWFDRVHPQNRDEVKDSLEAFLAGTDNHWSADYRSRHHDGTDAVIHDRAFANRDKDGRAVRMAGLMTDGTEHKLVEEALCKAHQRFAAFMDNLPGFAWMKDLQGRYVYINKRYKQLIESRSDWEGKTDVELWPSKIAAHYIANDQKVIASREVVQTVEPYLVEGNQGCVLVNKFPICENSNLIMVGGAAVDITERMRAEAAMQESEERFRLLVTSVKDYAIIMMDPNGHITSWNDGAERINGYTAMEVIGRHFSMFYDREDMERGVPLRAISVATTEGRYEDEGWRVRKDGSRYWMNVIITAIRNDTGELRGFSKVTRDITEQRHAERLLRQLPGHLLEAQEAERKRVARELHDSVSQTLSLAKTRMQDLEKSLAHFDFAPRHQAAEVHELLQKTLEEVRRISNNLMPSELEDLGLVPAVRTLCSEYGRKTGLTVNLKCSQIPNDLADSVKLAVFRIIQEALTNVEKHAKASQIILRLFEKEMELNVAVEDNGIGFDPKSPGSRKTGETRMGLANMRERAKAVGGTLDITSFQEWGTIILVCIPLEHFPTEGIHCEFNVSKNH